MSLSSLQLDAFYEVSQTRSFSRAAKNLFVSQSALSQRVLNLENELGVSLFVRETTGIRLTDAGQKLLRYCQAKSNLEVETLDTICSSTTHSTGGEVRIGAFSSIFRSVIMPAIQPIVAEDSTVRIESFVREVRELPELFRTGEIDYMILDHKLEKTGVISEQIGVEKNVLVKAFQNPEREQVYLDHDMDDRTTEEFFKQQTKSKPISKRLFLDDVYGIIEGVRLGYGSAVVPEHLIRLESGFEIQTQYKPLYIPIILHYYEQPFYSKLHEKVVKLLTLECEKYL